MSSAPLSLLVVGLGWRLLRGITASSVLLRPTVFSAANMSTTSLLDWRSAPFAVSVSPDTSSSSQLGDSVIMFEANCWLLPAAYESDAPARTPTSLSLLFAPRYLPCVRPALADRRLLSGRVVRPEPAVYRPLDKPAAAACLEAAAAAGFGQRVLRSASWSAAAPPFQSQTMPSASSPACAATTSPCPVQSTGSCCRYRTARCTRHSGTLQTCSWCRHQSSRCWWRTWGSTLRASFR
ncbi:hypothetical protein DL89DRAFT_51145 [Linderina pennispora]|uniref:Secreted protein n=1 Tax=Linderina pennispora TaxID=61395 RepID=A0A1Y1W0N0_9FUNG|nr:uncharacterized protein DL89DRAFT_51145 [Linderina pennispora]ORX67032.1 hypothetical protein DL89DRAFT_51145 [Linderina pennispora]